MPKRVVSFLLCFMLLIACSLPSIAAHGETKFQYDSKGQLVEKVDSEGGIEYQYDQQGNLVRKNKTNNLLMNPSFDMNTGNNGVADKWGKEIWSAEESDFHVDPLTTASNLQKISGSRIKNNGFVAVSQVIRVSPNKSFHVSGRFNIEQLSNAKVQLYVDFSNDSSFIAASVAETQNVTNGEYVTLSANGVIPSNTLYAKVHLIIRGISDGASGTMYVDMTNFSYDSDGNLLSNGSFDKSTQNSGVADGWGKSIWSTNTSDFELIRLPSGARVQKVTGTGIANNGTTGVSQLVAVEPGKPFQVSGSMNIEQLSNAKIQLYVDFSGPNGFIGASVTESNVNTRGGYVTLSSNGTVPPNTQYALVYALIRGTSDGASGTMYVDMMNFKYEVEPNLFANGSFDTSTQYNGVADGWGKSVWSARTSNFELIRSAAGARVQKITGSGIENNGAVGVSQAVRVDPDKLFQVSGRFNIEQLTNAKVQLYVDFFNASGGFTGANVTESSALTNGEFVTLSSHGIIPPNTMYAVAHALVRGTSAEASGTMYVDMMNLNYATEGDLVTNGKFEVYTQNDGVADGWGKSVWGAANPNFELIRISSGSRVQKVAGTGIANHGIVGVSQLVKVEPGKAVNVSGSFNVEQLINTKVQLYVDYFNGTEFVGATVTESSSLTNGGYVPLSTNGTVPRSATHARIYALLRGVADNASGTMYVDSVGLKYVK
ncbi:RHS repeat domain-containing protein [Paenibacillus elgii]